MKLKEVMRMIIGTIIFVSALLAYMYNYYWLFFTMFIGINMFQSAFTKWCFLEEVLIKVGVNK